MATFTKGDKVIVNLKAEGKIAWRNGTKFDVDFPDGRYMGPFSVEELTRVVPKEPGVGAIVEIDGKRWIHIGGYSKWAEVGTHSLSTLPGRAVSYLQSGKTWEGIYKPDYLLLAGAL
jgi:hypothetical protein